MPIFQYKAFDNSGRQKKGTYDASSPQEVRQYIQSQQWHPVEITESHFIKGSPLPNLHILENLTSFLGTLIPWKKNYRKAVSTLSRQLEILLGVGIPYDKALEMVGSQTQDKEFQHILSGVRAKILEGESLHSALKKYPKVFSVMFVSMVRSGENSGQLDQIMKRLADYYENQEQLIAKLKSAMTYPIFMMVFSVSVVIFMMTSIVPKITAVFETRGAALPIPTQILINASDFLENNGKLTAFLTMVCIMSIYGFLRSAVGIRCKERVQLQIPVLKDLALKSLILQFCQTLSTLLHSGVDLKNALEIAKNVVVNHVLREKIETLIVEVNNQGSSLSNAMRRSGIFPEYVLHVVSVGEEAAKLDELLGKVAVRMQTEVSNTITTLTSLLQPLMVIFMGGMVGFIALAMLLPMLDINRLL